jgi:hypothetical protein
MTPPVIGKLPTKTMATSVILDLQARAKQHPSLDLDAGHRGSVADRLDLSGHLPKLHGLPVPVLRWLKILTLADR